MAKRKAKQAHPSRTVIGNKDLMAVKGVIPAAQDNTGSCNYAERQKHIERLVLRFWDQGLNDIEQLTMRVYVDAVDPLSSVGAPQPNRFKGRFGERFQQVERILFENGRLDNEVDEDE
jgi:hypothetical protein